MTQGAPRLSKLLLDAADLAGLVAFYRDCLGLSLNFQDGDRYAEFEKCHVGFAVTSGEESTGSSGLVMAFAVEDLEVVAGSVAAMGGDILSDSEHGPHERRMLVADPDGRPIVLYQRLP